MQINQAIIDLLGQIKQVTKPKLHNHLKVSQVAKLIAYDQILAEITPDKILLNKVDIIDKLTVNNQAYPKPMGEKIDLLLEKIGQSITAINHLGISYQVDNINQEVNSVQQVITNSNWHFYEEKSSVKSARWFFVGDRQDWHQPLFEIVLNQPNIAQQNWYPHFQIDLDTSLTAKKLDQITSTTLGNNLISWKKNYLQMFVLGEIKGVKLVIGIGTTSRRPQKQRQNLFAWN